MKFDVDSLFFKNPDFTFFESREFFLSPSSECDVDLDIKLNKVPSSTKAKRLQQEQRFKVKQIAEGLKLVTAGASFSMCFFTFSRTLF